MGDQIEQWCRQAKAGDEAAANRLIEVAHLPVFAFLRRLCGNEDDAADLTQRTFAKAWSSLANYEERSSFLTWLHAIAHHVYVDWRRKRNPLAPQTDQWWESRAIEGPTPFESTAERDQAYWLYAQVEQLEEDQRMAVHLHYYQDLSLQVTAEIMQVSVGTVKNRLRDALEVLRARSADPQKTYASHITS